jgi:hypothetical protein
MSLSISRKTGGAMAKLVPAETMSLEAFLWEN